MAKDDKTVAGELIQAQPFGRPTKYSSQNSEEIGELLRKGFGKAQIAAHWKISRQTLDNWLSKNEDLRKAFDAGQPQAEAWWMEVGTAGMLGQVKGFNATIWMANMNNRFGWSRKDKDDIPQINIENMQVLQNVQQLNDKDLDAKIHSIIGKISYGQEAEEGTSGSSSGTGEKEEV